MIQINLIHYGTVTRTMNFASKRAAKKAYTKNNEIAGQYTQLVVDGKAFNTAQARSFFRNVK